MLCDGAFSKYRGGTLRLNPCFNGICSAMANNETKEVASIVLILVLMEYALRFTRIRHASATYQSLNPCFNGICSAIYFLPPLNEM